MRLISYIFPIYNEADNIALLHKTVTEVVKPLKKKYEFEFIYINDGSKDDSLKELEKLHKKDSSAVIVDLARNFGHQIAVTAGLDVAKGDAVIIMDSDMQDPPKVSLELIERWEEGYDVVYAQRRSRKDTVFKRATANLFYRTLHSLAEIDIPRNTGDFRLIDRKVVEEVRRYTEHNRFLRGMISNVGFRQTGVLFDRDERHAGETGYPLRKMLKFAADGIMSFSSAPLRLISRLGYIMSFLSVIFIVYTLSVRLFYPTHAVEGWAFIVISIFLVGGIQLIMLGVLGSYIGRIYTETQNRPLYSIRNILRSKK
ncbi:MAG TPA: glycosyltransferase family 2 protein [Candidatus Saccharimonadales bacterium]|nr:glycosyltransferase family 2 protein [Candidatus Saccharimonadales bacterium]